MNNITEKVMNLRNAVNESAQLTKNQVDAIKFHNQLSILISLGISLGWFIGLKLQFIGFLQVS